MAFRRSGVRLPLAPPRKSATWTPLPETVPGYGRDGASGAHTSSKRSGSGGDRAAASAGDRTDRRRRIPMPNALLRLAHDRRLRHRRHPYSAMLTICALSSLLTLFAAAPAFAQALAGDVSAGRQLVQAECSACHEEKAPLSTLPQGPSLRAVAAMPSTTSMSLHVFLLTPHANMPDYHLTPQEIDDVVAYILSLRR